MDSNTWDQYLTECSGGEPNNKIAARVGVDPATVGRWRSGAIDPKPRQAISVARAYDRNPLEALIAAGYLSSEDIGDVVTISAPQDLTTISTRTLVEELESRVEAMSEYAGWIRAIAKGTTSPAVLGEDVLRYMDPAVAPADVDPQDFVDPIAEHLVEHSELQGNRMYGVRSNITQLPSRDVGGVAETERAVARKKAKDRGELPPDN